MDQRVLRWFGHKARTKLMAEVSGGRVRSTPRLGWMDGVKVDKGSRGMTVEAAKTGRSGVDFCSVSEFFRTTIPRSGGA